MSKSILAGATALAFMSAATPALGQHWNYSLHNACSDLRNGDDIKICQSAFVKAAENLYTVQKRFISAPHYERYGRVEDPDTMETSGLSFSQGRQIEGISHKFCVNIAFKNQSDPASERLDDGTRIGLLRIAERAKACADRTHHAAVVHNMPRVTSLIENLRLNAEDVKGQINKIAMAY